MPSEDMSRVELARHLTQAALADVEEDTREWGHVSEALHHLDAITEGDDV